LALDVIGQNTANVGTPGYSRQVASLEETEPYGGPGTGVGQPAQLGSGVTVASVVRVRDEFLDKRINSAISDHSSLNTLRDILSRVEGAYGEPSTTGIGSQLTAFFNSFSDLAASPESSAVRTTVLNKAQSLIAAFHTVSAGLSQIQPEVESRITGQVGQVNLLASQIAALNKQIGSSIQSGDHPNDLLDRRTALIGQLSGLVDVQVIDSRNGAQSTGRVQVNVGGFVLVDGDTSSVLPSAHTTVNGEPALLTTDGKPIPLQGGEIAGLIRAGTQTSSYQADLDTLASNVIGAVNSIHSAGVGLDGVTGRSFFSGKSAVDIDIAAAVANNSDAIAAASAPVPPAAVAAGNGDNARALAALASQPVIGQASLNQYYNSRVATVGADSQRVQSLADNQAKVVTQLQNQQASASGVNLDEELTKLLQFQRSYQAAARIINVQDDLLNRVINGLGVGATG